MTESTIYTNSAANFLFDRYEQAVIALGKCEEKIRHERAVHEKREAYLLDQLNQIQRSIIKQGEAK